MSADTSKMEEVINKPDDQFEATLIDLVDYNKETSQKEALIKEFYQNETSNHHHIKPAASINSSNYSSAASSSSSSSNSSTNSTSSTSSTLSSPSQSNPSAPKGSSTAQDKDNPIKANNNEFDGEIEMAFLEDMGKTATIVEHRPGDHYNARYFKNFVAATTPYQFHESALPYRPAVDHHRSRSASHNLNSHKNPGSRKKRPVEQPVFSQHIPGHKGEQEVDWLVNFIKSGDSSAQTSKKTSNNNRRAKSQNKKLNQLDNDRDTHHQSRKTLNVNGGRSSSSSSSSSSSGSSASVDRSISRSSNDSSTGDNFILSVRGHNNTNNIGLVKSNLVSQARPSQNNQQRPLQNSQQMAQPNTSQRKSHPPVINDQQQSHPMNHLVTNSSNKPSRPQRAHKEATVGRAATKPNVKSVSKKQNQDGIKPCGEKQRCGDVAVTFADHIRISDDETAPCTFGFFDEQKPKLMKTSPKSDRRRYLFKDNVDANSFNYQQIIQFISDAWKEASSIKRATNASK